MRLGFGWAMLTEGVAPLRRPSFVGIRDRRNKLAPEPFKLSNARRRKHLLATAILHWCRNILGDDSSIHAYRAAHFSYCFKH